jgi:hypothetical protein
MDKTASEKFLGGAVKRSATKRATKPDQEVRAAPLGLRERMRVGGHRVRGARPRVGTRIEAVLHASR